jgi:hypothetical protein
VPENLADLDDAMMLLGAYIQVNGKLRQSRLDRLREVLGGLPSVEAGKAWKSGLRELRSELAALEARANGRV